MSLPCSSSPLPSPGRRLERCELLSQLFRIPTELEVPSKEHEQCQSSLDSHGGVPLGRNDIYGELIGQNISLTDSEGNYAEAPVATQLPNERKASSPRTFREKTGQLPGLFYYVNNNSRSFEEADHRLQSLQSKVAGIKALIHRLEGDLVNTRKELAHANEELYLAASELAEMQRSAMDVDLEVARLVNHQNDSPLLSPLHLGTDNDSLHSARSSASMHFFTPTSSLASIEDLSHQSPRITEIDAGGPTPLKSNVMRKRFDFGPVPNFVLANDTNESITTPSTTASTQEDLTRDSQLGFTGDSPATRRRFNYYHQRSYMRAHDLQVGAASLISLHGEGVAAGDIINGLFRMGYETVSDESSRWTQERDTGKILSKRAKLIESGKTVDGPIGPWDNAACSDEVLVWTSKCSHDGFGCEYPIVRARGLIPSSAKDMVDLLLDSSRVKDYNKMSLGRRDEHCFMSDVDDTTPCSETGLHGETRIMRSQSQPPVIRKPVELRLLLHARRLSDGYLTVGRSVWETEEGTADLNDTSATRCEMLLSVNLIRDVPGFEGKCEITTVTHGVSPGIPVSIGKRIALAAASKYIRDIRQVFDK
ncbi:hypothetical protein THAOC_11370 [Thalassiosira oceanica]|uniref:START domain-containing protein n=1 Tax=Thalassiosira oceanica TaxID=159749 RepID=K0TAQ2_THAOC|nr:hypothetical protein THAOC_11370 [Thalassiosira oceanica]|eukprot:EJK67577.1 hypothetical protein THAOC_11370 [Thalassiosira oceanica]